MSISIPDPKIIIKALATAIACGDNTSVANIRTDVIAYIGPNEYVRYLKQAYLLLKTKSYNFPSFDAKVFPQTAEEYNVDCEASSELVDIKPGHNED